MRQRQREALRARERTSQGPSKDRRKLRKDPVEEGPPGPIGRRSIIGALAALLGIGLVGSRFWQSQGLPEPNGQIVGPEYRAATLARQRAPTVVPPPPGKMGWTSCFGAASAPDGRPRGLDLVLVIDTTGSMAGVLGDVKARIAELLASLKMDGSQVRVGIVAYRDYVDTYVVRSLPMVPLDDQGSLASLTAFVSGLQAAGGGDWPEAMAPALDAATSMAWRGDVPATIVVIADAPPHARDEATATSIVQNFQSKIPGSQVSLVDTGSGGNAFMRHLPSVGGGKYVTYDGKILNSLYPAINSC
jgi:hypothetical protein